MVGFGAKLSLLQKLEGALFSPKEVGACFESLHRMHDQVQLIQLPTGRRKKIRWKAACGAVQNGGDLSHCNGRRSIEGSSRAAAEDYLLNCVLRLFLFWHWVQADGLLRRTGSGKRWLHPPPLTHFLFRCKRRLVVHLKHGRILDLTRRKRNRLEAKRWKFSGRRRAL